jgi:septal ring factor EnvC (AmiA/AmiB activator)
VKSVQFGVLIFFSPFFVGCTNLQEVNTTAGQLVTATTSWNAVADDFQASCVRRNEVSDVASDCGNEKLATTSLEAANKILSAYFTALQQASASGTFSIDPGLSKLSSSVQAVPGMSATQVQAASGLATFLADTATLAIQQRTLDHLISQGAPKAIAVIDAMSDEVIPQLKSSYEREASQNLAAFSSYINQSGEQANLNSAMCATGVTTHGLNTGIAYLLAQAYCERIDALSAKQTALENYKTSLATAKTTLENLQSGKDNLGAKSVAQQLVSETSSLKSDIEKINKAF